MNSYDFVDIINNTINWFCEIALGQLYLFFFPIFILITRDQGDVDRDKAILFKLVDTKTL
ncbi:hypothetical protein D3C71_1317540 [compost metagenome]